jgi:hypothetical protein
MTPKYRINLFWSEADGARVADVPDLRSCAAFDDTPAQALAEIEGDGGLARSCPSGGAANPGAALSCDKARRHRIAPNIGELS